MRSFFWGPGRWNRGPRGYSPWGGWGRGRWGGGRWGGGGCGCCGLLLFVLLILFILAMLFVIPRSPIRGEPPADSRPVFYVMPAGTALAERQAHDSFEKGAFPCIRHWPLAL